MWTLKVADSVDGDGFTSDYISQFYIKYLKFNGNTGATFTIKGVTR